MSYSLLYRGIRNQNLPFVFLEEFSDFINSDTSKKFMIISDESGNIIPAVVFKSAFLRLLQFHFAPVDSSGKRLSFADESLFLEKLIDFISKKNLCDKIIQGTNYALFQTYPKNSIFAPFGTYLLNLEGPIEEIWKSIQARYRSAINNAKESNIKIVKGEAALPEFYKLNKATLIRSNMHIEPIEFFINQFKYMPNSCYCAVIYINNIPEGSLFMNYSRFGAFYQYGGSAENISNSGLIKLLHWDAIVYFKSIGVAKYDFVGARLSKIEGTRLFGIQQFKQRFGSNLVEGYLWKMELNKVKCIFYNLLLKTKLLIKKGAYPHDIIDQERASYKKQGLHLR